MNASSLINLCSSSHSFLSKVETLSPLYLDLNRLIVPLLPDRKQTEGDDFIRRDFYPSKWRQKYLAKTKSFRTVENSRRRKILLSPSSFSSSKVKRCSMLLSTFVLLSDRVLVLVSSLLSFLFLILFFRNDPYLFIYSGKET